MSTKWTFVRVVFSYSYHYSIEEKRRSNVLGRNLEKEAA